jgi:hypothetical protein
MSLHNQAKYNTTKIVQALINHGMTHDTASQVSDAFRMGWVAASSDGHERCDKCDCGFGGSECNYY